MRFSLNEVTYVCDGCKARKVTTDTLSLAIPGWIAVLGTASQRDRKDWCERKACRRKMVSYLRRATPDGRQPNSLSSVLGRLPRAALVLSAVSLFGLGCKDREIPADMTGPVPVAQPTTYDMVFGTSTILSPVPAATAAPTPQVGAVDEHSIVVVIQDKSELPVEVQLHAPNAEKLIDAANNAAAQRGAIQVSEVTGLDKVDANSWKSKPNWQNTGNQIVLLRYATNAKYGQTIEVRYTVQGLLDWAVKSAGKYVANLKIFRLWPAGATYVNLYEGQSPGTQECHLYAENMTWKPVSGLSAWALSHRSMNYSLVKKMFDGQRHEIVRTIILPSGLGKNDGRWTVTVDGYIALDVKNLQVNDAAHPAIPNVVNIQVDISNHKQPASSNVGFYNVQVGVR